MDNSAYNEYKFVVTNENLAYIKNVLDAVFGGSDPFAHGIVDSIYYEDALKSCLDECENGDLKKHKVRIRGYDGSGFSQFQLKLKDLNLVRKIKIMIEPVPYDPRRVPTLGMLALHNDDNVEFGNLVARLRQRGELSPFLRIRYLRYRYRINDYRVTLDTNIEVMAMGDASFTQVQHIVLPYHVLEVKTGAARPYLPLLGLTKLPQLSFSKFFLGLTMLQIRTIA